MVDKMWSLYVAGKEIDLDALGINNKYDTTLTCLKDILAKTEKVQLCKGVSVSSGR